MTDLFGGTLRPQQTTSQTRTRANPDTGRSRSFAKPAGGTPREALDALSDIHADRLGVLDNTDRIVQFTDYDQVRQARNDDVIAALVRSGYVTENDKERVSCLHGAVRRPVVPLTLTRTGRALLERWTALDDYLRPHRDTDI
jgi:hypothetical protein